MTGRELYAHLAERDLLDRRLFVEAPGVVHGDDSRRREVVVARVVLDPPTESVAKPYRDELGNFRVANQQHVVLLEGA